MTNRTIDRSRSGVLGLLAAIFAVLMVLARVVPAAAISVSEDPCPGYCSSIGCDAGTHDYRTVPGPGTISDQVDHGYHGCGSEGECMFYDPEGYHAPCAMSLELSMAEYDKIARAAASGNADQLARLLKKHARVASLNVERHAVQLVGCGGGIRSNFPVSAEVVADLIHQND